LRITNNELWRKAKQAKPNRIFGMILILYREMRTADFSRVAIGEYLKNQYGCVQSPILPMLRIQASYGCGTV